MSVTDGDRERAQKLLEQYTQIPWDLFEDDEWETVGAVAVALAEERERAQAPFLALADELECEGLKEEAEAKRLGKTATAESWWGSGAASLDAAARIRRAAEESE